LKKLEVNKNDVVVDFGCGPGFFTIPFAKTARRVIAIDVQAEMLEKAAKQAEENNVKIEFLQSDGKHISLPNSTADLIFLSGVFHELDDKRAVLKELSRLLKPKGRLAIKEKAKRSFNPLGPPIVKISEITDCMQNAGLRVHDTVEIRNDALVIGVKHVA